MDSDTFYGDFMIRLIWRLSGDLIYHTFSMKIPDNIQPNFTRESVSINLHTEHSGN